MFPWPAIVVLMLLAFKSALPAVGTDDYKLGCKDGEKAAKGNAVWILGGATAVGIPSAVCLAAPGASLPLVLVALTGSVALPSLLSRSSVPASILVGKSSDYARGYSEGLAQRSTQKNSLYALLGGAAAGAVFGTLFAIQELENITWNPLAGLWF